MQGWRCPKKPCAEEGGAPRSHVRRRGVPQTGARTSTLSRIQSDWYCVKLLYYRKCQEEGQACQGVGSSGCTVYQ